jgi:hypothetical protein
VIIFDEETDKQIIELQDILKQKTGFKQTKKAIIAKAINEYYNKIKAV